MGAILEQVSHEMPLGNEGDFVLAKADNPKSLVFTYCKLVHLQGMAEKTHHAIADVTIAVGSGCHAEE